MYGEPYRGFESHPLRHQHCRLPIANCQFEDLQSAIKEIGNWQSAIGNEVSVEDNKLAADEARRSTQHESVKSQVEADVNAEIADRASAQPPPGEARKIDDVAGQFRSKAVDEVVDTEREVQRGRGMARISQVVDYIFYILYALLGMRFLLALLAARSSAGFVQFIVAVTNPFYRPFRGIVASPSTDQGHTLLLPIIVAIIAYIILHLAINGLLRILAHRKTQI